MGKTVFAAGIAACGEKEYLNRFNQFCNGNGETVHVHHLGELLLEIGRREHPDINKYSLLNYPTSTVNAWRNAAFEQVLDAVENKPGTHIVDAHATFWVNYGPETAVNMSYLQELDPDMYVQFMDYEVAIHNRLEEDDQLPEEEKPSLEDVIRWQETERFTMKLLAEHQQNPFYVIAANQPPATLYNLLFDEERPAVYQSYPITHLEDEEHQQAITEHVNQLRKHATVFDPGTIELTEDAWNGSHADLMNAVTVKRDIQLVDQADMVIVKFPEMVYSSGVEYEVNYAARTDTPVWIVKPEGFAGPFTDYTADRVFASSQECVDALQEHVSP